MTDPFFQMPCLLPWWMSKWSLTLIFWILMIQNIHRIHLYIFNIYNLFTTKIIFIWHLSKRHNFTYFYILPTNMEWCACDVRHFFLYSCRRNEHLLMAILCFVWTSNLLFECLSRGSMVGHWKKLSTKMEANSKNEGFAYHHKDMWDCQHFIFLGSPIPYRILFIHIEISFFENIGTC
jgi:hypothetical protein